MGDSNGEEQMEAMARAVKIVLEGLGEDVSREGLLDTPKRVAKAMMFAASGYSKCVTKELGGAVFSEESVSLGKEFSNVVLVRDIEFHSTHEADLMPFYGRVHIAYVPKSGKVIGLSKFARITEVLARRLQSPDRLAAELAEELNNLITPHGVAVVMQSRHLSHTVPEGTTSLSAGVHGCLSSASQWQEVMALLGLSETAIAKLSKHISGGGLANGNTASRHHANGNGSAHLTNGHAKSGDWDASSVDANCSGHGVQIHCTTGVECGGTLGDMHARSAHNGRTDHGCDDDACCSGVHDDPLHAQTGKARVRAQAGATMEKAAAELLRHMHTQPFSRLTPHNYVRAMLAATRGSEAPAPELVWPRLARAPGMGGWGWGGSVVLEMNLKVQSLCEHHLLPFHGVAHVAYIPGPSGPIPRSLLEEIVSVYSLRMQVQERLTRQIAHAVAAVTLTESADLSAERACTLLERVGLERKENSSDPEPEDPTTSTAPWGALVVVEAAHLCMLARGVRNSTSVTTTRVMLGQFTSDAEKRLEWLKRMCAQPYTSPALKV